MSLFSALSVSASGMAAQRTRAELLSKIWRTQKPPGHPMAAPTGARTLSFNPPVSDRRSAISSRWNWSRSRRVSKWRMSLLISAIRKNVTCRASRCR